MKVYVAISIFLLFSCSNNNDVSDIALDESKTLRQKVEVLDSGITWTLGANSAISTSNKSSHEVVIDNSSSLFFVSSIDTMIYPTLEGFGSLNVQTMPSELLSFVNLFLDDLQKKAVGETFFSEEKQFLKKIIDYNSKEMPEYTSYVIGEAFKFENPKGAYQIPIRLFFDTAYLDCMVFCLLANDSYIIEQFDIGAIVYE